MREVNQLRDSAANAWRKHREELIPWGFGSLIYIVFMRQAGPSKFTVGMLAFLLSDLLDGEYRSQNTGTKPVQVQFLHRLGG
jgi:hypothetical protein